MKGYKAFEKGMICKGKQYAENTVFEEESAKICESGMHFCKNPLDVLGYYPLVDENGNISEFAEVEALDEAKTDDGEKYCTKKLKIGAKISFSALVQASLDCEFEKTTQSKTKKHDKDNEKISSRGGSARIGSSGDRAQIKSTGKNSVICCAGHGCCASAKIGSWITLAEWRIDNGEWVPFFVKTEYVDGERIKEDTMYKLENGEFVEVEP